MAKKMTAAPALVSMTKADLSKLNRSLKDLHDAADEASIAVANFYKTKIKKVGINTKAYQLAEKLNRLDNAAKIQGFLLDFDRLRELYGWDAQQNLFEEDKTAVQKKAEKAESANGKNVVPMKKPNGNGAAHATKEPESKRVGRTAKLKAAEEKKAVGKKGRAALFDEDAEAPEGPMN